MQNFSEETAYICLTGSWIANENHVWGLQTNVDTQNGFAQVINFHRPSQTTNLTLQMVKADNHLQNSFHAIIRVNATLGWNLAHNTPLHYIQNNLIRRQIMIAVLQGQFNLIRIHPSRIQSMRETIGNLANRIHHNFQISTLSALTSTHARQFTLHLLRTLNQRLSLLPLTGFRWRRTTLQQGHNSLTRTTVRQCQVEWGHPVIVLQMQGIGIILNQQTNHFGRRLIARSHVQWKGSILIAHRCSSGMFRQKQLDGLGGCLPHTCVVNGQIPNAIGKGRSTRIGLDQSLNRIYRGLEGCSGV
mmetsp:Transcript_33325/g.48194  ORF Transcript_33325/g.48194 Transcript_33325/m.48194 type:complete len:302 (-) Transcript_33325:275-1180(-)